MSQSPNRSRARLFGIDIETEVGRSVSRSVGASASAPSVVGVAYLCIQKAKWERQHVARHPGWPPMWSSRRLEAGRQQGYLLQVYETKRTRLRIDGAIINTPPCKDI